MMTFLIAIFSIFLISFSPSTLVRCSITSKAQQAANAFLENLAWLFIIKLFLTHFLDKLFSFAWCSQSHPFFSRNNADNFTRLDKQIIKRRHIKLVIVADIFFDHFMGISDKIFALSEVINANSGISGNHLFFGGFYRVAIFAKLDIRIVWRIAVIGGNQAAPVVFSGLVAVRIKIWADKILITITGHHILVVVNQIFYGKYRTDRAFGRGF